MIVGYNQSVVVVPNKSNNSNDNCLPIGYDVPNSHSLFAGCVKRNDTLLFSTFVNKPAHWYKTNNKVLYYAPGYYRNTTITGIRCYDLKGNNSDGYANVLYGGVGYRDAKIRLFNTMANRKLNFRVEIYGHP
ncbi:PREDICTED: uncharacterized protein LOC108557183 [Nicrophorus vespilloides]|uniref:Uncharacterized protein LOC108557183 n=1 Tax=Nicrophorus vespilloides TaxID=110193 RepID=A0ABM1M3F2_NICVS|nr:PREDICTED: uncharacterized protein LOC108557183 [Nicrophorus vespilloides]